MTRRRSGVHQTPKTSTDAAITAALDGHKDGRTPVELSDLTGADYTETLAALERLAATGTVLRSRRRIGSWTVTPSAAQDPSAVTRADDLSLCTDKAHRCRG